MEELYGQLFERSMRKKCCIADWLKVLTEVMRRLRNKSA